MNIKQWVKLSNPMFQRIPYSYYSSNYYATSILRKLINEYWLSLIREASNTKLMFLPKSLTPNSNRINKDPSFINNNQNCMIIPQPSIRLNHYIQSNTENLCFLSLDCIQAFSSDVWSIQIRDFPINLSEINVI